MNEYYIKKHSKAAEKKRNLSHDKHKKKQMPPKNQVKDTSKSGTASLKKLGEVKKHDEKKDLQKPFQK